jgi:hypothetical protein
MADSENAGCDTCSAADNSHQSEPFVPPNGLVDQVTFICPSCGQHWWQFDIFYHLWQAVSAKEYAMVQENEASRDARDTQ